MSPSRPDVPADDQAAEDQAAEAEAPAAPATPAAGKGAGRGKGTGSMRLAGWVAMAILLAGAMFVGVADDGGPRTTGERSRDLAASVACPTCDGQSVADSDSSAARNVRTFIEDRIAQGVDDDQIRDDLAARYGDEVLLTPGRSGLAGLVWVLPVAALVAALAGVGLAFRRWRAAGVVHASDADRELVDRARAGAPGGAGSG